MNVSVILPTYNRIGRLQQVLAALARQTYDHDALEVIVVSDGSRDGTDQYLSEVSCPFRLVFVSQQNAGPAAARNRGIGLAKGDLVVFIDDDVVATSALIEQHVRAHAAGGEGMVVIGPMLTPLDAALSPWVAWEQAMLYKQYDALVRGHYGATYHNFYTGNASIPRSALVAVGGFDVRYRRAEDIEMAYRLARAGSRFGFTAAAAAYHYAERSFESWLRNAYDYGTNAVVMARAHDDWDEMARRTRADFSARNPYLRSLVRASLRHPGLEFAAHRGIRPIAKSLPVNRVRAISRVVLSTVYNVTYYEGMAAQLGDPRAVLQIIES